MHIILFALATHPTTENYNFQTWVHLLLMLIHLYISTVIAKCSCIFTLFLQIAWQNKSSFGWTSIRREAKLPTKNKGRNQNASQQFWRGARNYHYLAFCFLAKSWWFAPWRVAETFHSTGIMQQNSQILRCSRGNINMRTLSTKSIHWWATFNMTRFILVRLVIEIFSDITWTLLQIFILKKKKRYSVHVKIQQL